ncbi:putative SWEET sugar transporter [Rosa chinensis]|uniref:Putative SWEET sugar transporter n=1 Tax=Rosa chinensis TaxID=74649 RepID=A0A2P6PHQ2_ROSCH|nr:putative SWEET sugar transporter [Rosa chinensis]
MIFFNVLMYSSPLFIMSEVIKTKSVKYMPFTLSIANFLNGCCRTSYALVGKMDYFILVSNGLGAIAGAVQSMQYTTKLHQKMKTFMTSLLMKCNSQAWSNYHISIYS